MGDYNDIFSDYVAPTNPKSDDNFNIFNVLDLEYDEVRLHSRILKYFIENDQGKSFLKVLTETILVKNFPEKKAWLEQGMSSDNIEVSIEKSINSIEGDLSSGRIDLLLRFNDLFIIIENKIFANDQEKQLVKYHDYLKHKEKFLLLYLTPDGRAPDPKSIQSELNNKLLNCNEDFHLISYKDHILKWLYEYEVNCNKSREILEQYITTLKKICRIMTEEDKNRILGLFKEDNKFIQNFHLIKSDIDTIQKQIHTFWGKVSNEMNLENIGVKKIDFKEGSIMFDLFDKGRGQMNFYIQYKPNFTESPFMSIWLNSKKQKEFENKKVDHQDLDFSFLEGYLQKQEDKELFTKDVFIDFIKNGNVKEHTELISNKVKKYLEEKEIYIEFLRKTIIQ
jgi:hypothetical protein